MNNNEIKTVALYIRVSTDRQAKEGDSLEAQENALMEFCKKNNYVIYDKYIDGGESGQKIKRTNLQRMLNDVKDNNFDLILITKLDRWFRSIADFYKIQEILSENNVDWKTIWEDYDTTTANGKFWLNMSLSMGQLEAQRTGERINEVFNYKFNVQKTICSGSIPFGYKKNKDKHLVIDENKKNIIINLFNKYDACNNLNETTRWFSNTYHKASSAIIKKYLTNPIYIGKYRRYKTKELIEDFAPPIIDEELFYRVQTKFQKNIKNHQPDPSRKRHNAKPYIFTGLLFCKECGSRLSGKCNTNSNHYYNCKKHENKLCSNKKCVRETVIEEYLLNNIINILEKKKLEIIEINDKCEEFVDNSQQIKNKMNKLSSLYLEDLIDKDYYKEQYNELALQLEDITSKKNKISKKQDYSYIDNLLSLNFIELYNELDNLEKRRLWGEIIDSIELTTIDDIDIVVY